MKIRTGIYTVNHGIEMFVSEYYGHGLNQEVDEKHRIVSYPANLGHLPGFELDTDTGTYKKDVLLTELTNAFVIATKLKFNHEVFSVWNFNPDKKNFTVFTLDRSLGKRLKFIELSARFVQEIPLESVSEIWEEVSPAPLNLPVPESLPKYKHLKLRFEKDA